MTKGIELFLLAIVVVTPLAASPPYRVKPAPSPARTQERKLAEDEVRRALAEAKAKAVPLHEHVYRPGQGWSFPDGSAGGRGEPTTGPISPEGNAPNLLYGPWGPVEYAGGPAIEDPRLGGPYPLFQPSNRPKGNREREIEGSDSGDLIPAPPPPTTRAPAPGAQATQAQTQPTPTRR